MLTSSGPTGLLHMFLFAIFLQRRTQIRRIESSVTPQHRSVSALNQRAALPKERRTQEDMGVVQLSGAKSFG